MIEKSPAQLQVVRGPEQVTSSVEFDGPPATSRPADRLEAVLIHGCENVERVRDQARRKGLPVSLALSLVTEGWVTLEALPETASAERLDATAAVQRLSRPLAGPSRDYLQTLFGRTGPTADEPILGQPFCLSVPMRLHSRVTAQTVSEAAGAVPLERAVSWEAAALVEDQSMSEWAALTLLRWDD